MDHHRQGNWEVPTFPLDIVNDLERLKGRMKKLGELMD